MFEKKKCGRNKSLLKSGSGKGRGGARRSMGGTIPLQFHVPSNRRDSADWFVTNEPERIADILDLVSRLQGIRSPGGRGESEALRGLLWEKDGHIEALGRRVEECRAEMAASRQEHDAEVRARPETQQKIHDAQVSNLQASSLRTQELHDAQMRQVRDRQGRECERELQGYKDQLAQLNDALAAQLQEKASIHQAYVSKLAPMIEANNDALKTFGSNARTGVVGENLVYDVFAGLNIGYLEDQRHSKDPGCEDYLWVNQERGIVCSVEVKFAERLHSQHDMQKHVTRIQEASRSSKANCALFLSLKCPIPNTKEVDIKVIGGIPVVYISGGAHKELTPHAVARLGFEIMSTTWSHLKTNTTEEISDSIASQMIENISSHYERQLQLFVTVEREVQNLTKQANALLRTADKLTKMRTDMVGDITSMQIRYPELDGTSHHTPDGTSHHTPDVGRGDDDDAEAVRRILAYNERHRRYPKAPRDLAGAGELPPASDFEALVKRAKLENRKRRRGAQTEGQ